MATAEGGELVGLGGRNLVETGLISFLLIDFPII